MSEAHTVCAYSNERDWLKSNLTAGALQHETDWTTERRDMKYDR
jgi:hypothetical protein